MGGFPQSFPRLEPAKTWEGFVGSFKMVMGCHKEREHMLTMNQHLTNWCAIAVPMDSWFMWPPPFNYYPAMLGPLGIFPAFFKFYDFLGG